MLIILLAFAIRSGLASAGNQARKKTLYNMAIANH
jgi:hypothetical protein